MRQLQIPLLTFVLLLNLSSRAQQKYALLVGINKYYEKPGKLHPSSLQGCVNDAVLFKNTLLQNFGFEPNNVQTIFDEQAKKENVISGLSDILSRAKTGDAVVFYFSGHGAWMTNIQQNALDRKLKRGMDQAIIMSNLYASGLDCLLTSVELKKIFNKFVDKGVVLTAIFDCCYSGGLTLPPSPSTHNAYVLPGILVGTVKSIPLETVLHFSGQISNDEEGRKGLAKAQSAADKKDAETEDSKSFNLKDALTVNDSSHVPRPSDRPHSHFLSITGTNDVERGLEISDETGTRHGAFTKALVQTLAINSPTMTVNSLVSEVKKILSQQLYVQAPQHYQDPERLRKNLLGIAPKNFKNRTVAKCQSLIGKQVQLTGGTDCGFGQGNLLKAISGQKKILLQIDKVTAENSFARVISGNGTKVRVGDQFQLIDAYTSSPPLLKIFIKGENIKAESFAAFCKKNIRPLAQLKNYMDYENWENVPGTRNIFFNDATRQPVKRAQEFLKGERKEGFVVLLPIPAFITSPLKKELQRNQNVQLVNNAAEADYVLYLNYVQAKNPHLDFIWYNFLDKEINTDGLRFNVYNLKTKSTKLLPSHANEIVKGLVAFQNKFIRARTLQWLNLYPRKAGF